MNKSNVTPIKSAQASVAKTTLSLDGHLTVRNPASGIVHTALVSFEDGGLDKLSLQRNSLESDETLLRVALAKTQAQMWSIINSAMRGSVRITVTQWQVLKVISENKGIGCAQIVEKLALLGPSLSRVLYYLADKKYITLRTAAADRRNKEITITPKGARIITAGNEALRKAGF